MNVKETLSPFEIIVAYSVKGWRCGHIDIAFLEMKYNQQKTTEPRKRQILIPSFEYLILAIPDDSILLLNYVK